MSFKTPIKTPLKLPFISHVKYSNRLNQNMNSAMVCLSIKIKKRVNLQLVSCFEGLYVFLSKLFCWERGRQKSGYDKMLICGATWPIKCDTYLLKFPQGSEIAPHTDKVESGKHYRLNIVLKKADLGGEFICSDPIFETKRVKLFRPDVSEHQVSKVIKGNRYLLSIGWIKGSSRC